MKVKLTPLPPKKIPTNRYILHLEFMSGDADHYDIEKYYCDDEEDFKRLFTKVTEGIKELKYNYDRDEQMAYWYKIFGDYMEVPHDVTCEGYPARMTNIQGFYYDENGVKFKAEVV